MLVALAAVAVRELMVLLAVIVPLPILGLVNAFLLPLVAVLAQGESMVRLEEPEVVEARVEHQTLLPAVLAVREEDQLWKNHPQVTHWQVEVALKMEIMVPVPNMVEHLVPKMAVMEVLPFMEEVEVLLGEVLKVEPMDYIMLDGLLPEVLGQVMVGVVTGEMVQMEEITLMDVEMVEEVEPLVREVLLVEQEAMEVLQAEGEQAQVRVIQAQVAQAGMVVVGK